MAKKKDTSGDEVAYAKVKAIILERVMRGPPLGYLGKRKFRMAHSREGIGSNWYLIEDEESGALLFLRGTVETIDGYVDGLNIHARVSPLAEMLAALGGITEAECEGFKRQARALSNKTHAETKLSLLTREAAVLGYTLTPAVV